PTLTSPTRDPAIHNVTLHGALPIWKLWDIGAGLLLVKEAGGRLANYAGRPVDDLRQNRQNVVASNGLIHDEMLAVLAQIYEFTDDGDFILKNEYRLPGM